MWFYTALAALGLLFSWLLWRSESDPGRTARSIRRARSRPDAGQGAARGQRRPGAAPVKCRSIESMPSPASVDQPGQGLALFLDSGSSSRRSQARVISATSS